LQEWVDFGIVARKRLRYKMRWIYSLLLVGLVFVMLSLSLFYMGNEKTKVESEGFYHKVIAHYPDKQVAADILSDLNHKAYILLRHLKEEDLSLQKTEVVELLLSNYDFDYLRETDPIWSIGHKSFTTNNKYISICLRKKDGQFYQADLLFFVFVHELSHVGTNTRYTATDHHPPMFWSVFGFLLAECDKLGLLVPVNYEENPTNYCDIRVQYNPFFDKKNRELLDEPEF
jgi:hypothetical protein